MGVGKTLSALWAADFLMRNEKLRKVLISCPLSTMRSAWARDIVLNIPNRVYAVAHGDRSRRIRAIRSDANFVIINHDGVKTVEDEIKAAGFELMIIDELTATKNYSADRTKAMERVARAIGPVWGLTGRPTPNSPTEAYGQAKVVNPYNPYLPNSYYKFRDQVVTKINTYIEVPKPNANDFVNRILQPAIRYTREQCVDLPPCTWENRHVELTDEQKSAYERMRKELIVEHQQGVITASNVAIKLLKLTQIAAGSVKDDAGNVVHLDCSTRMKEVYEIFQGTPQRKLVIFAAFRADIERIVEFFNAKRVNVAKIYGDVSEKERAQIIRNFQDGNLEVVAIQPQSAAHGITLTASSTIVWYSLIPSNEYHIQANDRIVRIGQTRPQHIIKLVGSPAEARLVKMLDSKEAQSQNLMEMFEEFMAPLGSEEELEIEA